MSKLNRPTELGEGRNKIPAAPQVSTQAGEEIKVVSDIAQGDANAITKGVEQEMTKLEVAEVFKGVPRTVIIDDNERVLASNERLFGAKGLSNILTLASATQALELVQGMERGSLIICDYDMPKMNGIEFARILKESGIKDDRSLTFILATGRIKAGLDNSGENPDNPDFDLYVFKPYMSKPKTLQAIAKAVLKNREKT